MAAVLASAQDAPVPPKPRTTRQVHRRLRENQIDDLVCAYQTGSTVYKLAVQFQVGRDTVSQILKRQSVVMRYRSLTTDQTEMAVALYASGLSLAQIAERMALKRSAIYNALLAAGLQLRKRPGWNYQ